MAGGRPPETYYVYSSIRGTLIAICVGHKAARKRAGTKHLFCNSKDAELTYDRNVQCVRLSIRETKTKRTW